MEAMALVIAFFFCTEMSFRMRGWFFAKIRLLTCLLPAFILIISCNPFSPKLDKSEDDIPFITEQKTTEDFFQNFRYAYMFKDSLLYADLLDSSFTFNYFDPDLGESGGFESWKRNTELRTTGRLLKAYETIDLTWYRIYYESDVDSSRHKKVYRDFRLILANSSENISLYGSALFNLRMGFDERWRIFEWVDETNY